MNKYRLSTWGMFVVWFALLGGCISQGKVFKVEPTPNFAEPVPVRLVPFDVDRNDPYETDYFFATGAYWTSVFSNDQAISETFTITEAHLEVHSNVIQGGQFTYFIQGVLTCEGVEYSIDAEGQRSFAFNPTAAQREAIQRGIVSTIDSINRNLELCRESTTDFDDYDRLRELKSLKDEGILTEAEFEAEKKKILEPD